jgi:hypothetical protein
VPGFFRAFPEVGIAGAWAEFKSVQLNSEKELIRHPSIDKQQEQIENCE